MGLHSFEQAYMFLCLLLTNKTNGTTAHFQIRLNSFFLLNQYRTLGQERETLLLQIYSVLEEDSIFLSLELFQFMFILTYLLVVKNQTSQNNSLYILQLKKNQILTSICFVQAIPPHDLHFIQHCRDLIVTSKFNYLFNKYLLSDHVPHIV